mgnify:CR=1 FL=1
MKAHLKIQDNQSICEIEVEGQRQDSLHKQLKDLTTVANMIGCYDAGDFLRSKTEKIEAKEEHEIIPNCSEC